MSNTRDNLLAQYCAKKREHDELEVKVRDCKPQFPKSTILSIWIE